MYSSLKFIHIAFAIASVAGFVLRGIWAYGNPATLEHRLVRIAPHILDTAFLLSGIWLIVLLGLNVTREAWLIAKFTALVAYIVLGSVALKRGRSATVRATAFCGALLTYLYTAGVALSKSPASWFAYD